jgi:hypothetical protein
MCWPKSPVKLRALSSVKPLVAAGGLYWCKGPCAGPNLVKFIAGGFIEYKHRARVKTCSNFLVNFFKICNTHPVSYWKK